MLKSPFSTEIGGMLAAGMLLVASAFGMSGCEKPSTSNRDTEQPGTRFARADIDLTTPQATFASQLKYLEESNQEDFVQTLTPPARMHFNAEVFARCRESVKAAPLKPDWDHAEQGMKNMHQVVRVHIVDGQPTGFHRLEARWFTDTIWCAPQPPQQMP